MTTTTRTRWLTNREVAAIDRAAALAHDFFTDGLANTWVSEKRGNFMRGLLCTGDAATVTRTGAGSYGGHFETAEGARYSYQIGSRSPINGCAFFTVERMNNESEWERVQEMGHERAWVATQLGRITAQVWELSKTGASLAEKMQLREQSGYEALTDRLVLLDECLATYGQTGERDFPGDRFII